MTMQEMLANKNRVVSRTLNGVTRYYLYDGWNVIEDYQPASYSNIYCYGLGTDERLWANTEQGVHFYHQDALGSVIALSSTTGAIVERYTYDVYGAATINNASGSPISGTAYSNRFLFTGREWISELNLYDYRNRIYSASIGRFLQTDPIRFEAGDVNIYRYCGNGPINGVDAMGLCTQLPTVYVDPLTGQVSIQLAANTSTPNTLLQASGAIDSMSSILAQESSIPTPPASAGQVAQAAAFTLGTTAAIAGVGVLADTVALAGAADDIGMGVKGIIQDGNLLATAPVMGISHEALASAAGVLVEAPTAGVAGTLSPGAEAFTAWGDGAITGSQNFNLQVSSAAQSAIRVSLSLPTP